MLSPQPLASPILLLSPGRTGTAVPLLVTWLVIDRCVVSRGDDPPGDPPALGGTHPLQLSLAVCVILIWTMVADSIVLLTVIVPLIVVCAARALMRRGDRDELSLAGAAAVAAGLGLLAPRVIRALGGYRQWGVGTGTAIRQLPPAA